MQESRMLQVVSIVAIVFGGLGALGSLSIFMGGTFLGAAGGIIGAALSGFLILVALYGLALAALYIWAGVMGVQNWENPEKAPTLLNIGIILVVVQVVGMVLDLIAGIFSITDILGLAIPVIYYMGAKQLME